MCSDYAETPDDTCERADCRNRFDHNHFRLFDDRDTPDAPGAVVVIHHHDRTETTPYSTVTDFARFRGLSTSRPRACATSAANTCSGTVDNSGCSSVGAAGISMR